MNSKLLDILFSILIAISLGLAAFALKWQFDANAKLSVIEEKLAKIEDDHTVDTKQDSQIVRFWKLHSWERDQINRLRVKAGMDVADWPDLGN